MIKKVIRRSLIVIALCVLWLVWLGWLSARPPLTTDAATLAGDGSTLNYCELPVLDGSGQRAVDIPKGNTPGCGYDHFPLPILAACTEPLPPEADDIRGLWRGISGGHVGHVEQDLREDDRIETLVRVGKRLRATEDHAVGHLAVREPLPCQLTHGLAGVDAV